MIQDEVPREPVVRAPMAQRAAEEQLLQLILADPTVALELVRFDDETTMNVVDTFPPRRPPLSHGMGIDSRASHFR